MIGRFFAMVRGLFSSPPQRQQAPNILRPELFAREAARLMQEQLEMQQMLYSRPAPEPMTVRIAAPQPHSPPHFEDTRMLARYTAPPGNTWTSVLDPETNADMILRGVGWSDWCAIELWRVDWPKSIFVFSSWLENCSREYAIGLYWRPFEHGRVTPRTWQ